MIPKLFIRGKVSRHGLKQFIARVGTGGVVVDRCERGHNRQKLAIARRCAFSFLGANFFVLRCAHRRSTRIANKSPLTDALLILIRTGAGPRCVRCRAVTDDCFDQPSALDNDCADRGFHPVKPAVRHHMRILYKRGRHLRCSVWCVQPSGIGSRRIPMPGRNTSLISARVAVDRRASTAPSFQTVGPVHHLRHVLSGDSERPDDRTGGPDRLRRISVPLPQRQGSQAVV